MVRQCPTALKLWWILRKKDGGDFNYSEKHDTHRHVSSLEHGRWLGVCCAVSPDGIKKTNLGNSDVVEDNIQEVFDILHKI